MKKSRIPFIKEENRYVEKWVSRKNSIYIGKDGKNRGDGKLSDVYK